jgi:DNA-binding NarL/FixJ family response regulator
METKKIKIILADDHKIIREGLKAMFESEGEIEVVAEAKNGNEIIAWMTSVPYDVIVTDVSMPGMDGLEALELIQKNYPGTKVLVLSMHYEKGWITKLLKAGAKGYLLKTAGKQELLRAIKTIAAGESYLGNEVNQILVSHYLPNGKEAIEKKFPGFDELSKREIEVLELIGQELTNKQIADKLFISTRTVDTHRRNLMQKLGVKNTAGMMVHAIRMGLLQG